MYMYMYYGVSFPAITHIHQHPQHLKIDKDVKTTSSTICLKWTPNDARGKTIDYIIEYSPSSEPEDCETVETADQSVTLKDLLPGTEYTVMVMARNKDGTSKPSTKIIKTKAEGGLPKRIPKLVYSMSGTLSQGTIKVRALV